MKAFVAGATGQTGSRIVTELIDRGIEVKALIRDLAKAQELLPSQVELIVGDVLKPETFSSHLADCQILICATGAAPSLDFTQPYLVDYQGTKNLVVAAKDQKIEQFVMVSSLCVSKFFHPLNLFWLVLWWKKQAENYLEQSGLDYTIIRPGGLKNEDDSSNLVLSEADTLFEGSIPRQRVAQVCVEALSQANAKNRILEILTSTDAAPKNWQQLLSGN